ncbi:MAG TPA: outer membrane beta-barrel protein [Burkholderiaceae bacterium]
MNKIRILCAAVLAGASFAAAAQSGDDAAPTHWRFGVQLGTVADHNNTEPVGQISLGYDFDRTWSVEALASFSLAFVRDGGLQQGDREFNDAVGARVLAALPMGDRWRLVGGLGLVNFSEDVGVGMPAENDHVHKTSPMVSLAAMYRLGRRWSLGAEVSSFTQPHSVNAGLRAEFHF